jgi:hypothetical protein
MATTANPKGSHYDAVVAHRGLSFMAVTTTKVHDND